MVFRNKGTGILVAKYGFDGLSFLNVRLNSQQLRN